MNKLGHFKLAAASNGLAVLLALATPAVLGQVRVQRGAEPESSKNSVATPGPAAAGKFHREQLRAASNRLRTSANSHTAPAQSQIKLAQPLPVQQAQHLEPATANTAAAPPEPIAARPVPRITNLPADLSPGETRVWTNDAAGTVDVPPPRNTLRRDLRTAALQPTGVPPVDGGLPPEEVRPGDVIETLPDPSAGPFRSNLIRTPLLPFGETPRPSAETRERYDRLVERTIDPDNVLDLIVGRPRLLVFKDAPFRIQVADPATADYQLITEREISIEGKKSGTTVLNLWFPDPDDRTKQEILSYLVRVIPDPEAKERLERVYEALEQEINRKFPNSVVYLSLVGDKLMIEGQAKDVEEAVHILDVVGQNAPGGRETIPVENIDLVVTPGLDGELPTRGLEDFLLRSQSSSVINRLRIPGVHQVLLQVTVAEVDRSALRSIGARTAIGELGNSVSFFSFTPTGAAGIVSDVVENGGRLLIDRGDFKLSLQALKQLDLARTLAEPTLVTLNGRPADLLVGGSFPVPISEAFVGSSVQSVQFIPFGVSLSFTPVVYEKDRIRLNVFASISSTNATGGTNIGDSFVPGLNEEAFTTIVELNDGQTLAVAGLLRKEYTASSDRVPFAAAVPVLGRLFKQDQTQYNESELVVLVTPQLVSPLECDEKFPLPGEDIFEPDDFEFYILGNIEGSHYYEDYRSSSRTTAARMKAFRKAQQEFILGPSGYSDGRY